ncbi:MAG: hypothetical protein HQM16_13395 [Deltaproteobacteria bacterium]|nr:hypothetical protein [Deltaproteobacteria bacterium]
MKKIALATQIPLGLKKRLDILCEEKGFTISHLTTEALKEKIDSVYEETALLDLALERLAEPGEHSYAEFKKQIKSLS